ncbi:MAG: MMPL family transporter [Fibromonadaceae bacterium]|jgi:predicted RND superfamily exporter protein|nr:MMPL family transporter [Fibromonadaceae bacterium]
MFSLITRFLLFLQNAPKLIIVFALVLSALSVYPVANLRWELGLADLLPKEHPAIATQDSVHKKFGGWQTLIILSKSPDSTANAEFIANLAKALEPNPLVNLAEYRTEADFYNEYKLLYINLSDLETINGRIKNLVLKQKEKLNPFIVDLVEEPQDSDESAFSLEDIEQKYLQRLKSFKGNADGTVQVLEIYPAKDHSNLQDMRELHGLAKAKVNSLLNEQKNIEVLYGGAVYDFVASSKTILSEIRTLALISALILIVIFVFSCFKIPAVSLITALCLSMATLWTFAAAAILFGRINIFTIILGLIIPGLGGRNAVHLLSRYTEEMQKGLSVKLALESTMLGIGQPFTVSAFISSSMFFCLFSVPLQGIGELGIAGGLGILFDWIAISTVLPAMLTVLQAKQKFPLLAKIIFKPSDFSPKPLKVNKKYALAVFITTIAILLYGTLPEMEYRFSKTEFPKPSEPVNEILNDIGEYNTEPVIVLFPSAKHAEAAADNYPQINWVTLASLLPREQDKKLRILGEIRSALTPEILKTLSGNDSANANKIVESWNLKPIKTTDFPDSYQLKFLGSDGSIGEFGFIFPAFDIDDGLECRRFAKSVNEISIFGHPLTSTGNPIIRAALLDLSLPKLRQCTTLGCIAILLWLLIFQNARNRIFLILISPAFGFLWFFGVLHFLNIPLTFYSILALPFLIGISIDGSLFLWQRYWEEGTGSLRFVCAKSGITMIISYLIPAVAFLSVCFSSHPGLKSLGVVTVMGIFSIALAHIAIFPIIASLVDERRYRRREPRE